MDGMFPGSNSGSESAVSEPLFRLFLSHATSDVGDVGAVARALDELGPSCFVAGDNIPRTTEWLPRIVDELLRCDALVVFISSATRASLWVDQEVGFALGRRKRVIPVRLEPGGPDPHGFLARYQALDAPRGPAESVCDTQELAQSIFDALLMEQSDRARLLRYVLRGLATERTLVPLRRWATRLHAASADLNEAQRAAAAAAIGTNTALRTDRVSYNLVNQALRSSADWMPRDYA
jgi:hypothetical protein